MNFDDLMRERERVIAEATLDTLITSLALLLAQWSDMDMPSEVRLIHAWLCEELEKRVPEIVPLLQKYLDEASDTMRYGQMVILAVGTVKGF